MADETDQAIEQLRAMPQDKQVMVIQNLKPERRAAIMARLQPKAEKSPQGYDWGKLAAESAYGIGRGIKGIFYDFPKQIKESGFTAPKTTGDVIAATGGPVALAAKRMGGDIVTQMQNMVGAAEQRGREGEGFAGAFLGAAEQLPFVGGMVSKAEEGGPHMFSPESIGATFEGLTYYAAPEVVGRGLRAVEKAMPPVLRERSAEINSRLLGIKEPELRDFGKRIGLEVAQQEIIAGSKRLPLKIEEARLQLERSRMARAAVYDRQGVIVNAQKNVGPIARRVADIANQRGVWDEGVYNAMEELTNRIQFKTDFQTNQLVPRNWDRLTVTEAIELTRHDGVLSKAADFDKNPTPVRNYARQLRQAIIDEMPQDIRAMGEGESNLISARTAAREKYARELAGLTNRVHSIIYSGMGAVATWEALRLLGVPTTVALGGLAAMIAFARGPLAGTFSAAMLSRLADFIDGGVARITGPTGAPPQPGAPMGGFRPNAPQLPVPQQVTGQTAPPMGGTPPPQPPTAGPTPTQFTRGTEIPARATRARAGSGDYVTPEKPGPVKPTKPMTEAERVRSVSPMAQAQEALRAEAAKASAKQTVGTAAGAKADTAAFQQAKQELGPNASISDIAKRAQEIKTGKVSTSITKLDVDMSIRQTTLTGADKKTLYIGYDAAQSLINREAGEGHLQFAQRMFPGKEIRDARATKQEFGAQNRGGHGLWIEFRNASDAQAALDEIRGTVQPKLAKPKSDMGKAMMDRLDVLMERQDNPKSMAERIAIDREIDEIKKIIDTRIPESDKKPLIERLQTRERVQAYRERQRAQQPVSTGATSGEMVGGQSASTAASPEQLLIGIDRGYEELAKLPGGAEHVKNMRATAKALKLTPQQQFDQIMEAVQFLKQHGGTE